MWYGGRDPQEGCVRVAASSNFCGFPVFGRSEAGTWCHEYNTDKSSLACKAVTPRDALRPEIRNSPWRAWGRPHHPFPEGLVESDLPVTWLWPCAQAQPQSGAPTGPVARLHPPSSAFSGRFCSSSSWAVLSSEKPPYFCPFWVCLTSSSSPVFLSSSTLPKWNTGALSMTFHGETFVDFQSSY